MISSYCYCLKYAFEQSRPCYLAHGVQDSRCIWLFKLSDVESCFSVIDLPLIRHPILTSRSGLHTSPFTNHCGVSQNEIPRSNEIDVRHVCRTHRTSSYVFSNLPFNEKVSTLSARHPSSMTLACHGMRWHLAMKYMSDMMMVGA